MCPLSVEDQGTSQHLRARQILVPHHPVKSLFFPCVVGEGLWQGKNYLLIVDNTWKVYTRQGHKVPWFHFLSLQNESMGNYDLSTLPPSLWWNVPTHRAAP